MREQPLLGPDRLRTIPGSCACIEHRFLREGCWSSLGPHERLLYVFLLLVAARKGLSSYSFDTSCSLLQGSLDE
jgi:hypothetical protein